MTTADLEIRRARAADLQAIIGLLADDDIGSGREDPGPPPNPAYEAAFAAIDGDPNQFLAVLTENDTVIGCLQIGFIPGLSRTGMLRGQIEGVRVASSQRGRGLGRVMIEWAVGECRKRKCGLVQLTSDKNRSDAIRFYESVGFVASHEGLKLSLG